MIFIRIFFTLYIAPENRTVTKIKKNFHLSCKAEDSPSETPRTQNHALIILKPFLTTKPKNQQCLPWRPCFLRQPIFPLLRHHPHLRRPAHRDRRHLPHVAQAAQEARREVRRRGRRRQGQRHVRRDARLPDAPLADAAHAGQARRVPQLTGSPGHLASATAPAGQSDQAGPSRLIGP